MLTPRLTHRRLAGCALIALAALAGGAWWSTSSDRVTLANYNRIRVEFPDDDGGRRADAMLVDEVMAIMGPVDRSNPWNSDCDGPDRACVWESWHGMMFVGFVRGRASSKRYSAFPLRERIRRILFSPFRK
jgi:hypothetical protein